MLTGKCLILDKDKNILEAQKVCADGEGDLYCVCRNLFYYLKSNGRQTAEYFMLTQKEELGVPSESGYVEQSEDGFLIKQDETFEVHIPVRFKNLTKIFIGDVECSLKTSP